MIVLLQSFSMFSSTVCQVAPSGGFLDMFIHGYVMSI